MFLLYMPRQSGLVPFLPFRNCPADKDVVHSGVAVGSSIGHAIGGMFGGGGSSAPAEPQQAAPPAESQPMDNSLWQSNATNQSWENPACETDVRNFRRCMDDNQGNMGICGWYLDQLVR